MPRLRCDVCANEMFVIEGRAHSFGGECPACGGCMERQATHLPWSLHQVRRCRHCRAEVIEAVRGIKGRPLLQFRNHVQLAGEIEKFGVRGVSLAELTEHLPRLYYQQHLSPKFIRWCIDRCLSEHLIEVIVLNDGTARYRCCAPTLSAPSTNKPTSSS